MKSSNIFVKHCFEILFLHIKNSKTFLQLQRNLTQYGKSTLLKINPLSHMCEMYVKKYEAIEFLKINTFYLTLRTFFLERNLIISHNSLR